MNNGKKHHHCAESNILGSLASGEWIKCLFRNITKSNRKKYCICSAQGWTVKSLVLSEFGCLFVDILLPDEVTSLMLANVYKQTTKLIEQQGAHITKHKI